MGDSKLSKFLSITPEERAAMAAGVDVPARADAGVNHLWAPEGHTLTQDADADRSGIASLDAPVNGGQGRKPMVPASHPEERAGMRGTSPADRVPARRISPEELLAQANAMLGQHKSQHEANLAPGPSTGERAAGGQRIPDWLLKQGY